MSRAAVAQALRLSEALVAAIEDERTDRLPAPAFVRGYLRAYARLVGVDPAPVLEAYRGAGEPGATPEAPRLETVELHRGWWQWLRWGSLATGAALVALVSAWWWGQRDGVEPGAPPGATAVVPTQEAAAPRAAPARQAVPEAPERREAPAARPGERAAPGAAQGAGRPGPDELELRLEGTSWVEVRDAQGRRLVYDLMRPGSLRRVRGRAPFRLVLGDPAAVRLRLNGEAVTLAGARPGRTLRTTVGAPRAPGDEGGP